MTEAGWTREKPTAAGWYWWRVSRNAPACTLLVRTDFSVQGVNGVVDHVGECTEGGEWLGPITPEQAERYEEEE